jgi:hypothetical protein
MLESTVIIMVVSTYVATREEGYPPGARSEAIIVTRVLDHIREIQAWNLFGRRETFVIAVSRLASEVR